MKTIINIGTLSKQSRIFYKRYHNASKFKKFFVQIASEYWPKSWTTVYFKSYPRFEHIKFPKPELPDTVSFKNVLMKRESTRSFTKSPITLNILGSLLFYTAGIRNNKPPFIGRFYPSGGARYPLEAYVISINTNFKRGVYHYDLKGHSLEKLIEFSKFDFNKYFTGGKEQEWILKSSCIVLITAVFVRNTEKYGDRGYRHILSETGHMAQNAYLTATCLGLGICSIGGYIETKIEELLDLNPEEESVVYVFSLGNKKISKKA